MANQKEPAERNESDSNQTFDFQFSAAADVNPLELIGNARLALHHHMAPADGGFDLEPRDDE